MTTMHHPKNRHESVPWFLLFCGVLWCCGNCHGGDGGFFVAAAPTGTGEDEDEAAPMVYDDAEAWSTVYDDDDDDSYGDTSRIVGGDPVNDGNKHPYFGT